MAKANLAAQALPLVLSPILTRLYTPSDFAALLVFTSFTGIVLSFSTWRFDQQIPNAATTAQAICLAALAGLCVVATALGVAAFLVFGVPALRDLADLTQMRVFLPATILAVIGNGILQTLQAWYVRKAQLRPVGRSRLLQSGATSLIQIVGGLWAKGPAALIWATTAGVWAATSGLVRRSDFRRAGRMLRRRYMAAVARRFAGQASWSTLATIANAVSLFLLPVLILKFYPAEQAGQFALVQRLAVVPLSLFGVALSQSFWAEASDLAKRDRVQLRTLYLSTTRKLGLAAVPVALACLAGPLVMGPIFGKDWAAAGWMLAALAPLVLAQLAAGPLSHLVVHQKQHWQLAWELARLGSGAAVFGLFGALPAAIVILIFSLTYCALYGVLVLLNLRALHLSLVGLPEVTNGR